MNYIYILSEDDNDDLFYEGCIETITGKSFTVMSYRLRRNGGISEVRRKIPLLLQTIQRTGHVDNTYFMIALDNDRSPEHPDHSRLPNLPKSDLRKTCRFCEIQKIVQSVIGEDRENWPIKGAIAVPVEMLESWLLLICEPERKVLPIFARQDKSSVRQYYASQSPPPQLKDLCQMVQTQLNIDTKAEFCLHCALAVNPHELASLSSSFALFKQQVDDW